MTRHYQRGWSLFWTAVLAAVFAAAAMAALFSMRYDRNFFAEAWGKLSGGAAVQQARSAVDSAKQAAGVAPAAASGGLRRCLIDGKTVFSDTGCADKNPSTRAVVLHDSHGIDAPKAKPKEETAPTSDPALDKAIEKNLH